VKLTFWLEERARWRCVLRLLRQEERVRAWEAPQRLRIPGTDAVVLAERAQLGATLEALAATPPPKSLPSGDNARLGWPRHARMIRTLEGNDPF